jgi:copper chaperone
MAVKTEVLKIEGMHCDMCVKKVSGALEGVAGVRAVEVDLAGGTATVTFNPETTDTAEFGKAVEGVGYKVLAG